MKAKKGKEPLRILAVVAHPHDITHMCGTLAHHVQRGDAVTAVAVTGGTKIHREKLYDELRKPRRKRDVQVLQETEVEYGARKSSEMARVCALFGIADVRVLPFPDMFFAVTDEVVKVLTTIVCERQPHLVLTNAPIAKRQRGYRHVLPDDHVATGVAVHRARAGPGAGRGPRQLPWPRGWRRDDRRTHPVAAPSVERLISTRPRVCAAQCTGAQASARAVTPPAGALPPTLPRTRPRR
ncbi:MAG: PIG-L family deacetylase [Candidatus Latescibacterota bacterium]